MEAQRVGQNFTTFNAGCDDRLYFPERNVNCGTEQTEACLRAGRSSPNILNIQQICVAEHLFQRGAPAQKKMELQQGPGCVFMGISPSGMAGGIYPILQGAAMAGNRSQIRSTYGTSSRPAMEPEMHSRALFNNGQRAEKPQMMDLQFGLEHILKRNDNVPQAHGPATT